jgi:hypothetical protein
MRKYLFLVLVLSANYLPAFTQFSSQTLAHGKITGNQTGSYFKSQASTGGAIILRGTIILPANVIKHGYVAIVDGRIASISDKKPDFPNAVSVNTNGIILPGLIDLHNHVPFNVLPRWNSDRLFTNRNQWRTDPEVITKINDPVDKVGTLHSCEMNYWGELRALAGGTTSIMVTQPQPCITGLVRNLDFNSGFYGTTELDREHIFNVLDLPPASNPAARAAFVGAASFFIGNPFYEALFIHLAEGTDAAAKEEFTFMQTQSLINPKGVVIHGIPLNRDDFNAMALHGTALVWSPRSNLELYGETANINAALDAGVEIAIAPDWAVTGSSNLLNELKVADQWNQKRLGGRISDQQLVNMVTSAPAHIAGVDDEVGAISAGLRADILIINGNHNNPYRALIDATAADVELVFIDGVPLYGSPKFMKHFWDISELEEIELATVTKALATPAANINVASIANTLQLALQAEGTSLAPLAEANDFVVSAAGLANTVNGQSITSTDAQDVNMAPPAKLTSIALSNPSTNYFTLKTQSTSKELLQLTVVDVFGRTIETRKGIVANTTFHFGHNFKAGIYLVELRQGKQRQVLKLVRL